MMNGNSRRSTANNGQFAPPNLPTSANNSQRVTSNGKAARQALPERTFSNGNGQHSTSNTAPSGGPPQHLLPGTVQVILQLGAERNIQASQMSSLTTSGSRLPHPVAGHAPSGPQFMSPTLTKLDKETEQCWVAAGRLAEAIGDWRRALSAYETALRHSPFNIEALTQTANILRQQEKFVEAAEYFTRVVHLDQAAGEVWGALGHCYLMVDDLPKAYACYQQAIVHIPDAKNEPKLWYGIGILYDRYGSLEHAEEAFASVIHTDPNFEKANEIYFRLGIIYKQQKNSAASLQCFKYILHNPPRPLTEVDIWFQIGHVYEQNREYESAKEAYDRVLTANANHAKVLQQLGGLYLRQRASFYEPDKAVMILTRSLEQDAADPFSWYLLGRAYMKGGNYGKAYEAYQQAVYRDGKNPAFWCSIGLLYYQINQFHDALDAYSRAIKINPYIAEVWHNLGALYESCNDQTTDAIDAYQRTLSLDENDEPIRRRLERMEAARSGSATPLSPPPQPRDISPSNENWTLATAGGQGNPQSPTPNHMPYGNRDFHPPLDSHRPGSQRGMDVDLAESTRSPQQSRPGPQMKPSATDRVVSPHDGGRRPSLLPGMGRSYETSSPKPVGRDHHAATEEYERSRTQRMPSNAAFYDRRPSGSMHDRPRFDPRHEAEEAARGSYGFPQASSFQQQHAPDWQATNARSDQQRMPLPHSGRLATGPPKNYSNQLGAIRKLPTTVSSVRKLGPMMAGLPLSGRPMIPDAIGPKAQTPPSLIVSPNTDGNKSDQRSEEEGADGLMALASLAAPSSAVQATESHNVPRKRSLEETSSHANGQSPSKRPKPTEEPSALPAQEVVATTTEAVQPITDN